MEDKRLEKQDYNFTRLLKIKTKDGFIFLSGIVVKGFQRGRKIGIRTANLDPEVFKNDCQVESLTQGVYAGWAQVEDGPVFKALVSVGYNPFFKNVEKSVETHILNNYGRDFYGEKISVCICGFIRTQLDFDSIEKLVDFINLDIELGRSYLDKPPFSEYKFLDHFVNK